MPWIVNEDAALKGMLQGIRVTDTNAPANGRQVPVTFRLPETEMVEFTPPMIVIEHVGWFRDPARQHSGYIHLPYAPEGYAPWWADTGPATTTFDPDQSPYGAWFPIPYNFDYQVQVMTRYMSEHMVPIVSALAQPGRLYDQWSYLKVPQDGTIRTMFLNGGPELSYGKDADDKHLFTTTYNVRVCSELLGPIDAPTDFGGILARATNLQIDLDVYSSMTDLSTLELEESFGVLSVGMASGWNTQ